MGGKKSKNRTEGEKWGMKGREREREREREKH